MFKESPGILLVGGGNMGGALLEAWVKSGLSSKRLFLVEPDAGRRENAAVRGAFVGETPKNCPFEPEVIVFAVKPQDFEKVLPLYGHYENALFVSIAAGRTIQSIERLLGGDKAVVRAMPNTPARITEGMTVLCANEQTGSESLEIARTLMGAVGDVAVVDSEPLMNVATAVSGCGPGYLFLFQEVLARAAASAGLPEDLAERMASRTVWGASRLMSVEQKSPEELRAAVTSPNGVMAATLPVLTDEETGFQALLEKAIATGVKRAEELSA